MMFDDACDVWLCRLVATMAMLDIAFDEPEGLWRCLDIERMLPLSEA